MEDEKDAFYIVRKGDIIGVYRSLRECQEQVGSSVSHPATIVYKGYGWPKAAEELVSSFGIKNALFSVNASYVNDNVFGKLIPCPFQQPSSSQGGSLPCSSKRLQEMGSDESGPQKHLKTENAMVTRAVPSSQLTRQPIPTNDSCTIEFDGASKGNPGKAGAGAVLRASDKSVLYYLREGVGIATNNVAEYRALILGLKSALNKGFKNVHVQGDSMLVCMQIQDAWKTKNPKMAELCQQAKVLKRQFKTFHIQHVDRELNSDADKEANFAIGLAGDCYGSPELSRKQNRRHGSTC